MSGCLNESVLLHIQIGIVGKKKKVGIDPSNSNEPNSAVINCINPQSPTQSRRINVTKPWTSKYSQPKRKL